MQLLWKEHEETFPETNTTKEKVRDAFAALSEVDRISLLSSEGDFLLDWAFDETKGITDYVLSE